MTTKQICRCRFMFEFIRPLRSTQCTAHVLINHGNIASSMKPQHLIEAIFLDCPFARCWLRLWQAQLASSAANWVWRYRAWILNYTSADTYGPEMICFDPSDESMHRQGQISMRFGCGGSDEAFAAALMQWGDLLLLF